MRACVYIDVVNASAHRWHSLVIIYYPMTSSLRSTPPSPPPQPGCRPQPLPEASFRVRKWSSEILPRTGRSSNDALGQLPSEGNHGDTRGRWQGFRRGKPAQ